MPNLETSKDISVYDMFYDCYGFLFRLQSDLYLFFLYIPPVQWNLRGAYMEALAYDHLASE